MLMSQMNADKRTQHELRKQRKQREARTPKLSIRNSSPHDCHSSKLELKTTANLNNSRHNVQSVQADSTVGHTIWSREIPKTAPLPNQTRLDWRKTSTCARVFRSQPNIEMPPLNVEIPLKEFKVHGGTVDRSGSRPNQETTGTRSLHRSPLME